MRVERWYWLLVFCWISFLIHLTIAYRSGKLIPDIPYRPPAEIEVALAPLPEPPATAPQEPARPAPPERPKPAPRRVVPPAPVMPPTVSERQTTRLPLPDDDRADLRQKDPPRVTTDEPVPTRPNAEPGGFDPTREERPITPGSPLQPQAERVRLVQRDRSLPPLPGGGTPSPAPIPGGKGGLDAPEAPPEDVVYNGGGAGGLNLPRVAPRIGGGGGRSLLTVENPLAKEVLPEEKPGIGPGLEGGEGAGVGAGVGFSRGRGIGTRPDGRDALATLKAKPGIGVGAGRGSGIGTAPPGGGTGTGAEVPGTGGEGLGYGRGKGVGIGDAGSRGVAGLDRGVPFGDITGLLKGDPDGGGGKEGGPGGPGRGGVFGTRPTGGSGGRVSIVYVLDVSGSMRRGDKIGKAKEALKKALSELKVADTFNIVSFAGTAETMSRTMVSATGEELRRAMEYVEHLSLRDGTNIEAAMDVALQHKDITHVFLLSDGEPTVGLTDPAQLRAFIKERNTQKASITVLALGLGEDFPGIPLLRAIAADNNGKFSYVNLAR